MEQIKIETLTVTCDASGDATVFSQKHRGEVLAIIYTADGTSPYAATADFTITGENSTLSIWAENNITASKTVHPTWLGNDDDGTATSPEHRMPAYLADERLKIVIAQGGNATTGEFKLMFRG